MKKTRSRKSRDTVPLNCIKQRLRVFILFICFLNPVCFSEPLLHPVLAGLAESGRLPRDQGEMLLVRRQPAGRSTSYLRVLEQWGLREKFK
jgi:hypothetical protein